MKPLLDNGQPGRVTPVENRVTKLEHWRVYLVEAAAAVAVAVDLAIKLFK